MKLLIITIASVLSAGCSTANNTFTFTADLPPNFTYSASVTYIPEKGQTCSVPDKSRRYGFNKRWQENYQPDYTVNIRKVVDGCTLIVHNIDLYINGVYGKDWHDFSRDHSRIAIRPELAHENQGVFNKQGVSDYYGRCRWSFRTTGKPRILRKLLECQSVSEDGELVQGKPFSAYSPEHLSGKTIRLKIDVEKNESPAWKNTWVKVQNGWKRCLGGGYEDPKAYCDGNHTDFSTFQMTDGRICSIYPDCTE